MQALGVSNARCPLQGVRKQRSKGETPQMPLPAVVAAALGIAAVLTPSMRNARDCLKPTSDSHAWATDMKTGTRLELSLIHISEPTRPY